MFKSDFFWANVSAFSRQNCMPATKERASKIVEKWSEICQNLKIPFFTCCYVGHGEYGAVAGPVPSQYSHSVVLSALQLCELAGSAAGITGVNVSVGLSQNFVVMCSSTGAPSHRRLSREAVQVSGHICRVTWCWRKVRKMAGCTMSIMNSFTVWPWQTWKVPVNIYLWSLKSWHFRSCYTCCLGPPHWAYTYGRTAGQGSGTFG